MQHHIQRIITAAEAVATACTVIGAFGMASGSISLLEGYTALLAGTLTTLGLALHRRDKGLLARQVVLASIQGYAISVGG